MIVSAMVAAALLMAAAPATTPMPASSHVAHWVQPSAMLDAAQDVKQLGKQIVSKLGRPVVRGLVGGFAGMVMFALTPTSTGMLQPAAIFGAVIVGEKVGDALVDLVLHD